MLKKWVSRHEHASSDWARIEETEFSGLSPVKRFTRMGLDGNVNAIYLAFHVNSGIIEASAVLDQMLMLDDSQYKFLTNQQPR